MSEDTAQFETEYKELIQEAFINPIRTVIVVDDQFPSLDGMIANEVAEDPQKKSEKGSWSRENFDKVQEILKVCREDSRRWFVDIHDAHTIFVEEEKQFAPHLHHSDLMILDYHLEGDDGGGTKAIEILRLLMENDHFNMVVVYTQGYPESGGDISRIIQEITLGLTPPNPNLDLPDAVGARVVLKIQEWEDEEPEIFDQLKTSVDTGCFLVALAQDQVDFEVFKKLPELQSFITLYEQKPQSLELNDKLLLRWLISEKQKSFEATLNSDSQQRVFYNPIFDENNWVRSERLFVTVVGKNHSPSELPIKLIDALHEWLPHPHRLIMSKMRAELDERGVLAEGQVLSNRYLCTGWLQELFIDNPDDRSWKIRNSINNHWDALGDAIQPNIESYATRLAEHLSKRNLKDLIKSFMLVDPTNEDKEIIKHCNSYNCSKTVEGSHLTTGYVLESDLAGCKEYWLCLSPACDLVPGQKVESGWYKRLGEDIPFKAVRLYPAQDDVALSNATKNNYVFLYLEDAVKTFRFTPVEETTSNPSWEQMFAQNQGRLCPNQSLSVGRVAVGQDGLGIQYSQFNIIAQLRYEYALNLLQRLGTTLSRVGLDFQNIVKSNTAPNGPTQQ